MINRHIDTLLKRYPKRRTSLPAGQHLIFNQEYISNREGLDFASYFSQRLESWMHRIIVQNMIGKMVLEIGAGTLNHFKYLDNYTDMIVDVIEPNQVLYEASAYRRQVRTFYSDIGDIKALVPIYDYIYSIAALEHITDLPLVIAMSGMLLTPGGVFANAIPCEGGLLWGLSWRLSTGLSYRLRTGYSYKNLMHYEHVNNYDEIVQIIQHCFEHVHIVKFPFRQASKHISLYAFIHASSPKIDVCKEVLSNFHKPPT